MYYQNYIFGNPTAIRRFHRTLTIIGFLLLTALVIIINSFENTQGYDVSIYLMYPDYVWVIFISIFIISSIGIVIFGLNYEKAAIPSYILILLTILLLLSLPIIRGYFLLGRGDVLSNWGRTRFVLMNGFVNPRVIYPLPIIWASELVVLLGISDNISTMIIPILAYICFCFSGVVLYRRISRSQIEYALLIVFGTIPIYSNDPNRFTGWAVTFFFIPISVLGFILIMRYGHGDYFRYILLFAIVGLFTLLGHPVNGIVLIFLLVVLALSNNINNGSNSTFFQKNWYILLVLISIVTFSWYFSHPVVQGLAARELKFLFLGGKTTEADVYAGFLGQLDILYLLRVALWRFGIIAIITGAAGLAFLRYLHLAERRNINNNLWAFIFCLVILTVIAPLSNFWVASQLYRLDRFNLFFGVMVLGISTGKILKRRVNFISVVTILLVLIIIISTIGVLTTYRSERVKQPGREVTQQEIQTSQWLFENGRQDYPIEAFGLSAERHYHGIYGERRNLYSGSGTPPFHFGYDENSSVSKTYSTKSYILISGFTYDYYPKLFPRNEEYWKWSGEDVNKLKNDESASKIFDSNETNVFIT